MRSWSFLRNWLAVVLTGCALVADIAGCGGDDSGSLSPGDDSGGDVTIGDGMSAGDADAAAATHDTDATAESDGDAMVTVDADATMTGTGDADGAAATGDADAAATTPDADAAAPDADAAPTADADAATDADAEPEQCTGAPDSGPLSITAVYASRIGQNLHLEVHGAGFGSAPTTLPAVGLLNQFHITDTTQGGWCAGSNGCAVYLQYTSWSDTAIVVDGFGLQYGRPYKMLLGDMVSIFVQSTAVASNTITFTCTLQDDPLPRPDYGGPTPEVSSVEFSQIGQNMHIEVDGAGFGSAPTTLPAVGLLNQFYITDTTQGGWCAGANGCAVYLHYTSWTDARIVIDGFGPQYGGQYKVASGDAVSIYIQNAQGPEFMIWTGTLP